MGEHPLHTAEAFAEDHTAILRKALQPRPRHRFEDGEAMARAIDDVLSRATPRVHSLTVRDWIRALDVRRRGRGPRAQKGILDIPSAGSLSLSTNPNARLVESTIRGVSDTPWSDKTELLADGADSETIIDDG